MNQATQNFLSELERRPDVLGVIMFGSWARGNNRDNSDVDLVVILSEGYRRAVEYHYGQAFEIIYTTEQGAFEYWESHKDDAASLWQVVKILFDKDGTIDRLKDKITEVLDAGKKAIDSYQLGQFKFDAEDQINYVEYILAIDPVTADFILTNKVFSLTELYFDIRQSWTPAPKQRLAEIQKIDPNFYALLQRFYQEHISLRDRLEIAKIIVQVVFQD